VPRDPDLALATPSRFPAADGLVPGIATSSLRDGAVRRLAAAGERFGANPAPTCADPGLAARVRTEILWNACVAGSRRASMHRLLVLSAIAMFVLATVAPASAMPIAAGVELLPGRFVSGEQPDGNTLVFDGADGLIVFDTGRHAAHTQAIIDYAHARERPVVAIFNSHWHLDHVGGNAMLRKAFPAARVHASAAIEDAMHGFLAKYRSQIEQMLAQPGGDEAQKAALRDERALIDAGPALYPDERITGAGPQTIAGRPMQVGFEDRAVTAGDVWLFDPKTRVLAAGDLVTLPAPLFDTACPAHWKDALAHLDKIDFATLVPGHGTPMTRTKFATYRKAFDHLLACANGPSAKDICIDGWLRDARPLIAENDRKLARDLLAYYLDGILRDVLKTKPLCE
jgi:glyoxylase-like metal-dependent hydrolase (beta-lactamase superfamily II)